MTLRETIRSHWPEYAMEAAGLGLFMIVACAATVLLEHPASREELPGEHRFNLRAKPDSGGGTIAASPAQGGRCAKLLVP